MKKIIIGLFSLVVIILIIGVVFWFNLPNIIANKLSKDLNLPVSISKVSVKKGNLKIYDLHVSNPKGSITKTAFATKTLDINTTIKQLRQEVLTIDSIIFNNVIIGVELYDSKGKKNNWATIMAMQPKKEKTSERQYLIKRLTLNQISVLLVQSNNSRQVLPTIPKLEFYNITQETGFPIDEIEQAIVNQIIKSVFKQFNLLNLIETFNPRNFIKIPFGTIKL